jgi:signal transduction histidine kinase
VSLTAKLVIAFAAVFTLGFAAVGYAAVRVAGETVERDLERRIEYTLSSISANPAFFIHEASSRTKELRQLADISGFEIVVPVGEDRDPGSSLPPETARGFLDGAPDTDRFETELEGVVYRGSRARVGGRTLYLLCPAASVETAKREAERPILLFSGVGLLVAVVLGAVLAGTITRPLRRLADRAAEVGEGRLDVRIPRGGGREVDELARAMTDMLAGLARYRKELVKKEKMATLGHFSAAAAHELRNPLSAMRMTLQLMGREAPESMRADLEGMMVEMARLDHSVEELLFHAGEPRYVMEQAELSEVVEETLRLLRPLAEHLGVTLRSSPAEGDTVARVDRTKVRQALTNLLLNAIQASEAGGEVTVDLRRDGDACVLAVGDRGPGVPPELSANLFEPFVTGREGGTGLGLAVTRAVAGAHDGSVDFERRDDWTVFSLRLPVKE